MDEDYDTVEGLKCGLKSAGDVHQCVFPEDGAVDGVEVLALLEEDPELEQVCKTRDAAFQTLSRRISRSQHTLHVNRNSRTVSVFLKAGSRTHTSAKLATIEIHKYAFSFVMAAPGIAVPPRISFFLASNSL